MYYYYDVLVNFTEAEVLYEFYEWEEEDNIEFIKKMPLFRVSFNTLLDLLKYQVKFSSEILSLINNKTILKSNKKIKYAFLVSDSKNVLALELNKDGLVISRSKLLLKDANNLNEMVVSIKEKKFNYEIIKSYKVRCDIRQIEDIKRLISCEVNTMIKDNNISKLKYLYYECFDKLCNNKEEIIKKMTSMLNDNDIESLKKIYDLIRYSYNKI